MPHSMVMMEQRHASLYSSNIPVPLLYTACSDPFLRLSLHMLCTAPTPHSVGGQQPQALPLLLHPYALGCGWGFHRTPLFPT